MSKNLATRKTVLKSVALALLSGLCLVACVGADPSEELDESSEESAGEEISGEEIGESAQAVVEGGTCGYFAGLSCDPGLNCCSTPPTIFVGKCRDLQFDEYNCGTCGHVCPYNQWVGGGWCYLGQCL